MYDASRDLDHTAQPDVFRVRTKRSGGVMLNRCATCHGFIWRTPERFVWLHCIPSRTARLNGVER